MKINLVELQRIDWRFKKENKGRSVRKLDT